MYDGNFIPATDLKWSMSKYLYLLLTPPLFCACLETGNGFPAPYVLIFIYVKGVKKSLKIPKGQSESVNRRTDNTMIKRQKDRQHNGQKKKNKRTNNDLQNIAQKNRRPSDTNPKMRGMCLF